MRCIMLTITIIAFFFACSVRAPSSDGESESEGKFAKPQLARARRGFQKPRLSLDSESADGYNSSPGGAAAAVPRRRSPTGSWFSSVSSGYNSDTSSPSAGMNLKSPVRAMRFRSGSSGGELKAVESDKLLSINDRVTAAAALPYAILAHHITRVDILPTELGEGTGLCHKYELRDQYFSERYKTVFAMYESVDGKEVAVVFKGTTTFTEWKDINLSFLYSKCPLFQGTGCNARIHGGFLKAFHDMREAMHRVVDSIKQIRVDRPGTTVVTAGHSLGGVMASLAATYLKNHGIEVNQIYTFGAPRFGDNNFVKYFKELFPPSTQKVRIVHAMGAMLDPVSTLLNSFYSHVTSDSVSIGCVTWDANDCNRVELHHFYYYVSSLARVSRPEDVCGVLKDNVGRPYLEPDLLSPPLHDHKKPKSVSGGSLQVDKEEKSIVALLRDRTFKNPETESAGKESLFDSSGEDEQGDSD